MVIRADIESQSFDTSQEALEIYIGLGSRYRQDQLFILESLSGPFPDKRQSVIGFDPILTLSVIDGLMTIMPLAPGHLADELGQCFQSSDEGFVYSTSDAQAVFGALRQIERLFAVHGEKMGPFGMGWFGYFGYDTIFMIENVNQRIARDHSFPVISLTLYRGTITLDLKNRSKTITVVHLDDDAPSLLPDTLSLVCTRQGACRKGRRNASQGGGDSTADNDTVAADGSGGENAPLSAPAVEPFRQYRYKAHDTIGKDRFYQWFDSAKRHIAQGDVYQLQLGHEITVDCEIEPFEAYRRLRLQDPSPYMYYFATPQGLHVIGASPELFVGLTSEGAITLRPIAGTVSNQLKDEDRQEAIRKLTHDSKERAEHLMLVDLGRNDVARCCLPESLEVTQLMVTEVYSHVIHMVSNVVGHLRPGLDKYDVFAAAFPAGTMTGTPKVRAVEIIEETKAGSRGIYAGTVGFFGFDGTVLSALCIRTASYQSGQYHLRASAGIVEDSQRLSEWRETLKKMSSAYLAITGKELADEGFVN